MSLEFKGKPSSWRRQLVIVVICFLAVSIVVPLLIPHFSGERRMYRHVNCLSNLKQLGLAVAMYADSSGGRCPMDSAHPTLVGSMQLLSNVATTAQILYCPSDHRPGARAETDFKKLTTLNVSYSYVPNLIWQDQPDSVLFLDRMYSTARGSTWPTNGNHGDKGGNVVFNDGHVSRMTNLPCALKDTGGREVALSP